MPTAGYAYALFHPQPKISAAKPLHSLMIDERSQSIIHKNRKV
ncbi:hypothetical protein [Nostoc sp.]